MGLLTELDLRRNCDYDCFEELHTSSTLLEALRLLVFTATMIMRLLIFKATHSWGKASGNRAI